MNFMGKLFSALPTRKKTLPIKNMTLPTKFMTFAHEDLVGKDIFGGQGHFSLAMSFFSVDKVIFCGQGQFLGGQDHLLGG